MPARVTTGTCWPSRSTCSGSSTRSCRIRPSLLPARAKIRCASPCPSPTELTRRLKSRSWAAAAPYYEDVVALLQENLEQEQHTIEEVKEASLLQLASELAAQTA